MVSQEIISQEYQKMEILSLEPTTKAVLNLGRKKIVEIPITNQGHLKKVVREKTLPKANVAMLKRITL